MEEAIQKAVYVCFKAISVREDTTWKVFKIQRKLKKHGQTLYKTTNTHSQGKRKEQRCNWQEAAGYRGKSEECIIITSRNLGDQLTIIPSKSLEFWKTHALKFWTLVMGFSASRLWLVHKKYDSSKKIICDTISLVCSWWTKMF